MNTDYDNSSKEIKNKYKELMYKSISCIMAEAAAFGVPYMKENGRLLEKEIIAKRLAVKLLLMERYGTQRKLRNP